MNKVIRKLKRSKKVYRYLYYLIGIIYIIAFFFFMKSLLSLKGIETTIRIIFIVFFILYLILYLFINLLNLLRRKYKMVVITSIISIIFIGIFGVGAYYIDMIYNNLSNMTDDENLVYTSLLISMSDTEFDNDAVLGMINDEAEIEGNILAHKLYSEEKLVNSITEYSDYYTMLKDLYNGDIDAIFVPSNYVTLFNEEEDYQNIANDTKVLYKYSEERENQDLVLSSNKTFEEPLTFLLLGVDSEDYGLNANAAFNGDTLMIITFNPDTLQTTMLSIPRDTYVPIACRNDTYAKINSAAAYGTNCVIDTVSNFLDVDIDYYVKINFKGVVELVDAIGGIEVDVEAPTYNSDKYDGMMCEQNSDREFGDHLVCIEPGWQTLNGEQALAYARNRHLYIGSDLDRIRHQQQVVEAIANKALGFSSVANLQDILNAVSNNIATNMDINTILSGYSVIKSMVANVLNGEDMLSINKAYLETYSLPVYVPSMGNTTSAQGYFEDSLEDIRHALKVTLGEEDEDEIKTFSFSVNEEYETYSPGKGKRSERSSEVLPSFIGKTVTEAENYCSENSIVCNIEYVDPDSEHYNSSVNDGLIGDQSVPISTFLGNITDITFYVVNSREAVSEEPSDEESSNSENDENKNNEEESTDNNDEEEIPDIIEDMLF